MRSKPQRIMKIVSLKPYELSIPSNFLIDHHLKCRGSSESIIIEVVSQKGVTGYGEGGPSKYVTNESIKGVISALESDLELKVLDNEYNSLADINLFVADGTSTDLQNIMVIRKILGDKVDIRVDANRSWTLEEALIKINQFKPFNISCVEEPLAKELVYKLDSLAKLIEIPIMPDESAQTLDHIRNWSRLIQSIKLIINIKISKSGGIQRASQLYHLAKKKGISCQLGCKVGESANFS